MKPFALDSDMTTLSGVFYPTGHVMLMVEGEDAARAAAQKVQQAGFSEDQMSLLSPQVIQDEIARTVGSADMPLPSAGTEADTVRQYVALASKGHWGLLVNAPKGNDSDRLMQALEGTPIAYAQKYRQLVIEDLA